MPCAPSRWRDGGGRRWATRLLSWRPGEARGSGWQCGKRLPRQQCPCIFARQGGMMAELAWFGLASSIAPDSTFTPQSRHTAGARRRLQPAPAPAACHGQVTVGRRQQCHASRARHGGAACGTLPQDASRRSGPQHPGCRCVGTLWVLQCTEAVPMWLSLYLLCSPTPPCRSRCSGALECGAGGCAGAQGGHGADRRTEPGATCQPQ